MPLVMRPTLRTVCRAMVLSLGLLLSACSLTDILKGTDTHYTLSGETNDAETDEYLNTIMQERLAERTKTLSDDPDERARQEDYIERIVRTDLLKALRAKGYYRARIQYEDAGTPLAGTYTITYGPRFTINTLDVQPEMYNSFLRRDIVDSGEILDAQKVLAAQADLANKIQKGRCYFSLSVENEVYLNRDNASADVLLNVDAGKEGHFGPLVFTGNNTVHESYLRKLVPWEKNGCFRREKLEEYKTALLQSGLFAKADVVLPESPDENGSVPITMDMRERAHRTLSAGLTYYSDEGPGALFGWEHRNFLGEAEKLSAKLGISALKQSLDFNFVKPYFIRKDQNLSLNGSLRRQDTDAYVETGIDAGAALTRDFTRHLSGSTGVSFSVTRIDDEAEEEKKTYGLISFPQSLVYDTRNDTLDPVKGILLTGGIEPFIDALGESDPFIKGQMTGSTYLSLHPRDRLILASKVGVGSIWGADIENIPATKRFYAGGGGTVRGFGYQEVGPQKDGDPTGGLSMVNFSLEMRGKVTDKFGAVAFVDGATVTEESAPTFEDVAVGAGIGIRYYTDFGPLRFDIAVPLTQKDDLERNYQFYISIGQAF